MFQILIRLLLELVHSLWFGSYPTQQTVHRLPWSDHHSEDLVVAVEVAMVPTSLLILWILFYPFVWILLW